MKNPPRKDTVIVPTGGYAVSIDWTFSKFNIQNIQNKKLLFLLEVFFLCNLQQKSAKKTV